MNPTIEIMRNWYDEYNAKYFNNSLPKNIYFELSKKRTTWGDCRYPCVASQQRYRIRLSVFYDRTEKSHQNTFIHEMIHIYTHFHYKEIGHGMRFKEECRRLNKYGWNLSRTTARTKTDVIERLPNPAYVFLFKNEDKPNKICLMKTSSFAKKMELINIFKKLKGFRLLDVKLSYCGALANLASYRTRIAYYSYTKEEFAEKFSDL